MTSTQLKRTILVPPVERQTRLLVEPWLQNLPRHRAEQEPLLQAIASEDTPIVAFCGSQILSEVLSHPISRLSLRHKVIYHMGSLDSEMEALVAASNVTAYLGYRAPSPEFLVGNGRDERDTRRPMLVGLRRLIKGGSVQEAWRYTDSAWAALARKYRKRKHPLYDPVYSLIAHGNRERLFVIGDLRWKLVGIGKLFWLDVEDRLARPRVTVVDISPSFLHWLAGDAIRIGYLSPEEFENLVTERLVQRIF